MPAATVLAVLPDAKELAALPPGIEVASSAGKALRVLRRRTVAVLICDDALPDARWQDVFESLTALEHPPAFVLASRLADEQLWVDVLDAGVYDLLAKPFEGRELSRVIETARRDWESRAQPKVYRAG